MDHPELRRTTQPSIMGGPLGDPGFRFFHSTVVNWTFRNKLQWNFSRNSDIFIQEIAFKNVVCKIACILFRPQWVNSVRPSAGAGGHFKNTYKLLNLRALKFSPVNKIDIFQCMGMIFCVEFQRYPFEIPHKICYPYIERYNFYTTLKF